jgi:hypothetical protein
MTNYQEGSGSYPEGSGNPSGGSYQEGGTYQEGGAYQEGQGYSSGASAYQGAPGYQGGGTQETPHYQGGQPPWQGYQGPGQGYPGQQGQQGGLQGMFSGSPGSRGRRPGVRSTFKTTEFWIYVVAVVAILIAAAVTDEGPDNQGFGAMDAWRYITWLTIGYLISRGLTKFGGHERGRDSSHDHDRDGH